MNAYRHILVEAVVFLTMVLFAFGGLAYAWKQWSGEAGKSELPALRRAAANVGFLAVSFQAVLFLASWWPGIGRDPLLFGQWARWIIPTFLIALPCIIAGKGTSRWWLLSSSILLFMVCFLIMLTP
jgi:hypothetical protein